MSRTAGKPSAPRFATRIAVWFGLMFISGIVIVVRLWYVGLPVADLPGAYQQRLNTATDILQLGADRHIAQIGALLREKRGDVLVIAENRILATALSKRDPTLEKDFHRVFERLQRAYPDAYHALLLVDSASGQIAVNDGSSGKIPPSDSLRGLIQRALQPGVIELVEQIETPHGVFVAIARQMAAPDGGGTPQGTPVGVLVAILNLPPFMEISAEAGNTDSAMSLLDSAGLTLVNKALGHERFVPDAQVSLGFEGALQQTLADSKSASKSTVNSDGQRILAVYRYYQLNGTQGWTLVHYTSLELATAGLRRLLVSILLSGFMLSILGFAVILFGARRVTAPLRRLATVADKLGSGQLDQRAASHQGESREVTQLAAAFNTMAEQLAQAQHRLEAEVTERTAEAVAARDQLLATLDALPDLLFEVDRDGRIYSYHSNVHDLLATSPEKFIGKTFAEVLPPDAAAQCLYAIALAAEAGLSAGTQYHQALPHGERWFEASVTTKRSIANEPARFIFLARDITDRKRAEDEVRRLAFFDPLTGLANRRLMIDRLDQARTASARTGHQNGLLLIDLDHFKNLNDTLGHEVGDQLLIEAGHRFIVCVREGDTVSRLGGDEFVIILRDFSSDPSIAAQEIERVAEKIRKELSRPFSLLTSESESHQHHITLSIGICPFNDTDISAEELLKRADTAMYQAKHAGRNAFRFFDPSMQIAVKARADLEEQLREAVAREQFVLHYQPLIAADGRCLGAEVLVRWQHPTRGLLSPAEFITQMELSGLILPLGHWVLHQACATLSAWQSQPAFSALSLAVNVSAKQMHLPNFVGETLAIIGSAGIPPQRLKLELTESLLLADTEDTISKMIALKTAGVRFALDDFGTGYSSLSYLKRLPLDQLKIDRSFVRDILTDPNDLEIARLVLGLAQTMKLTVLAEGVETAAQHELLLQLGCHAFQGYLFAKALPLGEFEAWARHHANS